MLGLNAPREKVAEEQKQEKHRNTARETAPTEMQDGGTKINSGVRILHPAVLLQEC